MILKKKDVVEYIPADIGHDDKLHQDGKVVHRKYAKPTPHHKPANGIDTNAVAVVKLLEQDLTDEVTTDYKQEFDGIKSKIESVGHTVMPEHHNQYGQ
jgi:hypothetical protein